MQKVKNIEIMNLMLLENGISSKKVKMMLKILKFLTPFLVFANYSNQNNISN